MSVPAIRITRMNQHAYAADGKWVLYWMTAYRRTQDNFALDRAIELAEQFQKPLLILEAIREDYEWACDRFHRFLIDGMLDNQASLKDCPVLYYPFLDHAKSPGKGLLEALARVATAVVSDDFPCFFYPKMYAKLASLLSVPLEIVDSNGLLPIRFEARTYTVAHSYRRAMQKAWEKGSPEFPKQDPFLACKLPRKPRLPPEFLERWPMADLRNYADRSRRLDEFRINHNVKTTPESGGSRAGAACLNRFIHSRLSAYGEARNEPSVEGSSGLSPYLHFGHVAAHQVFRAIMDVEKWTRKRLNKPNGKVNGFWGVSENAEAFLDQLATWREIGFNSCVRDPSFDQYDSLPSWAKQTLAEHASDRRPYCYALEEWRPRRHMIHCGMRLNGSYA